MLLRTDNLPWPISQELRNILQHEVNASGKDLRHGVVINFRDPEYSAGSGGYHPVEVSISGDGALIYCTDFCIHGLPPHAEIAKEIDFDFGQQVFQHMHQVYPIKKGRELFKVWEQNFIQYYKNDVYEVQVSTGW